MNDEERAEFVDRMTRKYGEEAAASITLDTDDQRVPQLGMNPQRLVWDAAETLRVTDDSEEPFAESNNYAALYATDINRDDSKQYYVYWLWSSANGIDDGIRNMWSHVNLTNDADITVYDTASDRSENGTIGPHPKKTGQDTDEFAVRWKGSRDRVLAVTGTCVERRDSDDERGFNWNLHLEVDS
ncbi:hypothetical protein G3I44_08340 [Halogeometricum borinquense]|uniref:Uncharacterized protein n=1 Tax=Halogeometricum borinquense TaxID=60847 RepID=A0A6C0UKB7_9EURY|nr:hypothetical protein [Halogeometricum borinquense]QIB74289.1 hypothetical protein G3I44_08340 [Halogeometricum borinquense]